MKPKAPPSLVQPGPGILWAMQHAVIYAFRSPGSGAVYIGKHEPKSGVDPTQWPRRGNGRLPDGYKGSGNVVPRFHERHGTTVQWRILAIVPLDDWVRAERRAIHLARLIFGPKCVNIRDGGEGFTSADAKRLASDPAQLARLRRQAPVAGSAVPEASRRVGSERWRANPDNARKVAELNREKPSRPGFREKLSQAAAETWADSSFRERHALAMDQARAQTRGDPEAYARLCGNVRAAAQRREADPDHKERKVAMYASNEWQTAVKKAAQRPEVRAKVSAASLQSWDDPQRKAEHSETQRQLWADPAHAAKMKDARKRRADSPEGKAQLAALHALNARRARARKALAPFAVPPSIVGPGVCLWAFLPALRLSVTGPTRPARRR